MIPADRLNWRTSSYSGNGEQCVEVASWRASSFSGNGENCVEVAPWRTSSFTSNGEACVEIAPVADRMLVRDTKCREAGMVEFTLGAWTAFLSVTTSRA